MFRMSLSDRPFEALRFAPGASGRQVTYLASRNVFYRPEVPAALRRAAKDRFTLLRRYLHTL